MWRREASESPTRLPTAVFEIGGFLFIPEERTRMGKAGGGLFISRFNMSRAGLADDNNGNQWSATPAGEKDARLITVRLDPEGRKHAGCIAQWNKRLHARLLKNPFIHLSVNLLLYHLVCSSFAYNSIHSFILCILPLPHCLPHTGTTLTRRPIPSILIILALHHLLLLLHSSDGPVPSAAALSRLCFCRTRSSHSRHDAIQTPVGSVFYSTCAVIHLLSIVKRRTPASPPSIAQPAPCATKKRQRN